MFCFLFPILPTSSCLFNGNYLHILCGQEFYVNKICILNWLSFSFLFQIYLPAYPPTHIHHWWHSSSCTLIANAPGCSWKTAPPKAGGTWSTRKDQGAKGGSISEHFWSWATFSRTVSKMTWQEPKSCCSAAIGEEGCMAVLATCCLSLVPQHWVWGQHW